jgi:hypothetical protein
MSSVEPKKKQFLLERIGAVKSDRVKDRLTDCASAADEGALEMTVKLHRHRKRLRV